MNQTALNAKNRNENLTRRKTFTSIFPYFIARKLSIKAGTKKPNRHQRKIDFSVQRTFSFGLEILTNQFDAEISDQRIETATSNQNCLTIFSFFVVSNLHRFQILNIFEAIRSNKNKRISLKLLLARRWCQDNVFGLEDKLERPAHRKVDTERNESNFQRKFSFLFLNTNWTNTIDKNFRLLTHVH